MDRKWKREQLAHINKLQKLAHNRPPSPTVHDRQQLLELVRESPWGLLTSDPRIRYGNVQLDIDALVHSGEIYRFEAQLDLCLNPALATAPASGVAGGPDPTWVLFPVDHRFPPAADDDIRALWDGAGASMVPNLVSSRDALKAELESALRAAGLAPARECPRHRKVTVSFR